MKDIKTCWQQWCSDFFLWGKPGRRPSVLLVEGAQPFVATNVPSQALWQGKPPVFDDGFVQHSETTERCDQERLDSDAAMIHLQPGSASKPITEQPGFVERLQIVASLPQNR